MIEDELKFSLIVNKCKCISYVEYANEYKKHMAEVDAAVKSKELFDCSHLDSPIFYIFVEKDGKFLDERENLFESYIFKCANGEFRAKYEVFNGKVNEFTPDVVRAALTSALEKLKKYL